MMQLHDAWCKLPVGEKPFQILNRTIPLSCWNVLAIQFL